MHSTVANINEAANYYPADALGISRKSLQHILGHNSQRHILNHQKIIECSKISHWVSFSLKARKIFQKHLASTDIPLTVLTANTIFHSLDHYNLAKYFLQLDDQPKTIFGCDVRLFTALFTDVNYDFGHWQKMKHTCCEVWKDIYKELYKIDPYLADKVDLFVTVWANIPT